MTDVHKPEPGQAHYGATHVWGGGMDLLAVGVEPTTGWGHYFVENSPGKEYTFYRVPPPGIPLDVMTPFIYLGHFPSPDNVEVVLVNDMHGAHKVRVVSGRAVPAYPRGALRSCRKLELGRAGSIPEVMVKWEGSPIPVPVAYCRTSSIVAYAEFCGPDDLLAQFWQDIVRCATIAGSAAGIAIIVAGPAAALPAFEAAFKPCIAGALGSHIGEIQVALSTQQQPNEDWHRC